MGFRVRSRRAAGPPCAFQFPTIGTAVEIAADTAVFEYEFGNMVVANNCAAHITREYAPNGALLLERQAIRTYYTSAAAGVCDPRPMPVVTPPDTSTCIPPNEWEPCSPPNETLMAAVTTLGDESTDDSRHVYELRYKYDLSGRRTELRAPSALCGYCAPQTCTYSDSTGELTAVTTFLGHTVRFRYDDAGRLYRTEYPGGGYEEIGFDFDDRIESRQVVAQGGPLTSAVYTRDGRGLMTTVQVGGMFPRTVQLRYNGAGAVVEALGATNSYASGAEFFEVDGLGNRLRQWRAGLPATSEDPQRERLSLYSYGRLEERRAPPALQPFDSMERWYYDQSGNQVHSVAFMDGVAGGGGDQQFMTMAASGSGGLMVEESRSYYGADNKLRVFNRHVGGLAQSNPGGVYEEYRYDALGRRVLTRSRTTPLCNEPCGSYIERVVWDGDQVLGEFRARGDMDDFTLEQDDAISDQSTQYAFGRVLYTHAGGIDMPVAIHRFGINVEPTVFPYVNWRGEFEGGLLPDGQSARSCVTNCPPVNWPGDNLTVDGGQVLVPQVQSWYGSLLGRKTDGSGLQYLRNRYHDPSTGRFTQVDPIGFAGGLNLYGFAGGDPVTFRIRSDCVLPKIRI